MLPELVVFSLPHTRFQLGFDLLQTGEYLSLQIFEFLLEFGDVVLLDDVGEVVDVPHPLLKPAFVEPHAVLKRVKLGPQLDDLRLDLVDLVLYPLGVVLLVEVGALVSAWPVENLQVLVDFPELHLEGFYFLGPLFDYALHVAAH